MYEAVLLLERKQNTKIDLVICCGDFQAHQPPNLLLLLLLTCLLAQAVRNMTDLNSLSCPPKYRRINTFYKYYSGEKTAPVLTILIGGNHEASNHLTELYWSPNFYHKTKQMSRAESAQRETRKKEKGRAEIGRSQRFNFECALVSGWWLLTSDTTADGWLPTSTFWACLALSTLVVCGLGASLAFSTNATTTRVGRGREDSALSSQSQADVCMCCCARALRNSSLP